METAPLKSFATKARTDLIKEVGARVSVVLAENSLARVESLAAVRRLEEAIVRDGRDQVIDRVAYTWFNRIIALRFMDANGYTPSAIVSPEAGRATGQPEVLAEAKAGSLDSSVVPEKTQETITALFNRTRPSQDPDGEAYGLLLEAYCRSWHKAMPFMFEREGDYTELLIPAALLAVDSLRDRAVRTLTEEVCRDVEVIGWLYQFYISERKDEVFDGFKKNKKAGAAEIPAATQLFTPHWIVRYLVENSVGRLWLLNNPSSRLAEQMDYYIKPVDEETDFLKIAKPEELKIIDPAVGSGHMLTYAFDLLYAIYMERGYDPAEIPGLILQHNLYGTEIDPRAGALAAFALTMKAAARRKLFLKNPVAPNVRVLEAIHFDLAELDYLWSLTDGAGLTRSDADEFWNAFEHADTFGSLIRPKEQLTAPLKSAIEGAPTERDLLHGETLGKAGAVLAQTAYLSKRYAVVVANPPYMGTASMGGPLVEFAARNFPQSKNDLFAMFIERNLLLALARGEVGMITMQSWMFLAAFQALRALLLRSHAVNTIAHLGAGAFESIGGEVVTTVAFTVRAGAAVGETSVARLVDISPASAKDATFRALVSAPDDPRWFKKNLRDLLNVPRSPFAYWFSHEVTSLFGSGRSVGSVAETAKGMVTADNASFVRQWWEVEFDNIGFGADTRKAAEALGSRWFPYARGGSYRKWFGNVDAVVDWSHDGRAIQTTMTPDGKRVRATNTNLTRIFKRGISWSSITTGRPSFRLVDQGHLYDAAGGICQSSADLYLMGLMNSRAIEAVLHGLNPTINLPPDYVGAVPVPESGPSDAIDREVSRAVDIQRAEWGSRETTWEFEGIDLSDHGGRLPAILERRRARFSAGQVELDALERWLDAYFDAELGVRSETAPKSANAWAEDVYAIADAVLDFISYAVGCMFGRYSLDEPGLILADQGNTLGEYVAKVPNPSFMPDHDNVIPIVDGDWFEDDIVARFRKFLRVALGEEHFEENLQFVTESLGVKDIRDYFVKSFYDDHVRRYKKRPIYWLFRSPKGSFSALIYLHRYNPSTASTVLTGYLREFIGKLEANLEHQGRVAAGMGGASPREVAAALKEADRIRKVLVELRDYEHDVLFPLAGQQIALDLDDGVLVNYQKLGAALKDIGLKRGGSGE
ncbi:BREX-1 system adenine-specific DNA-methyltransferase PglX [Microbacterium terricola]|uniref:site-specific DNA-methyltransferase (adenine-specific) n=1 Tax=Microbacterium terricola TaxID=344163 RepID=A0ABM8E0B4_9MICO|nr:BREX-1 system adenine-specific DNA-methyltransferase PglX [Microbacterium terricola]UYK40979.1 BREX-1 system adenine-specific DNA-methyltransferase PglX [Microbacterium terricola]BDV31265.1 hypothetical protein Microterr_19250 [Microbacterium terricola]